MNVLFKELVQLTFYKIMSYNKMKLYLAVQGKFKTETKKEAVRWQPEILKFSAPIPL